MSASAHLQPRQFYHGTLAEDLQPGDLIESPRSRGVEPHSPDVSSSRHNYFTTNPDVADWAAAGARNQAGYGTKNVYHVEPTGHYTKDVKENDSYKSVHALRIVGKVK